MADCIFCKIIKKEIHTHIVYEDKDILAFLDINPVNQGHTLVIPKQHYKMMSDTPDNLISTVFIISKRLMRAIKTATNAEFIAVSVVGLDVPHFHVHLIPRQHNDGLANFWPTKKYKENEAEKIAIKIKESLSGFI